jgi:DMSO/TMAO reductase YedYZ molybdopterin-dependent catalytic subunit
VTAVTNRVQRAVAGWPAVHLESGVPAWTGFRAGGFVRHERVLSLADLRALETVEHVDDFHCVWGWSKPAVHWTGTPLAAVLALVGVDAVEEAHVVVSAPTRTRPAFRSPMPRAACSLGRVMAR